ncbi:tetratricopeptide repeat protein [Sphingomonas sp. VNH70]|uniref:tetratricopeptide repeat protein n=1 Tax=Sphingomonas silueang TaxID=3156617 RepID=UPI0032B53C50
MGRTIGKEWQALRRRAGMVSLMFAATIVLPAPAAAEEWLRADTPHLEVYSNAGRSAVEGFARKIETYDAFLRVLLGVPDAPPGARLHVYLLASEADMKTLWPAGGFAGFYDASGDEPMLVVRYNRVRQATTQGLTGSDADDTAFHEYTHYFQQAHFPSSYPGWVIEGYAQYLQTIRIDPDAIVVGHGARTLTDRLKATWLPWDEVLRSTTGTLARDKWNAFYGQAWLLTHYLSSDPKRSAAFNRYLVSVGKGGDPVRSLTEALGTDLPTLNDELMRYYRAPLRVQRFAWTPPAGQSATVASLQGGEAALRLLDARTRYFVAEADRPAFVEKVRAVAANHPQDRFAMLAAARVDAKYGDAGRAVTTLAPLLADGKRDVDALAIRGRARMRQAAAAGDAAAAAPLWREARVDLRAAVNDRANDAELLYRLALASRNEPSWPTRETIAMLAQAMALSPQSEAIRLTLGEALLKAGRGGDARLVLQSLLNAPHDTYGKTAATALLAKYPGA